MKVILSVEYNEREKMRKRSNKPVTLKKLDAKRGKK
jgi:hypothetical protein